MYYLFSDYMNKFDAYIKDADGNQVLTYDYVDAMRDERNPNTIIAQRGCQEKFLTSDADITIIGGNRGGSKSFSLLLEAMYDIYNPYFLALILRNERDDLMDIAETAEKEVFYEFGDYARSKDLMTWTFKNGGKLKFSYFAGSVEDFTSRFRGRQYSYIAVDEITQIEYAKFKFLITCNRNARHIRNRFLGSCNPDPDCWVRPFIDWWIGEDGLPIEERDGVVRYCFMNGDSVNDIYWGDTRQEVYEKCKNIIDERWTPELEALGLKREEVFIKSVTFIRGRLQENIALLSSAPEYLGNLAQQSEEARARDLDGNWNYKTMGGDRITIDDMERFFTAPQDTGDTTRYVSGDIAFEGGDFLVLWLWEGLHIKDVFVSTGDSATVESLVKTKLLEWGVREENFVYDFWGVGQALGGHVPRATKYTGTQKPVEPYDKSYRTVKAQDAELLVHYIQDGVISIESRLLERKFSGKKGKYSNTPLREILMKERKCIRQKERSSFGGFELCDKNEMIRAIGYSPDFFESLIYRMYYERGKMRECRMKRLNLSFGNGNHKLKAGRLRKISFF